MAPPAPDPENDPANQSVKPVLEDERTYLIEADRMAGIGMLAAGVAHEISNPLASIVLSLGIFARELPRVGADPARVEALQARLAEMREAADRVANIIRDLRTFARLDSDRPVPVDPRHVMQAAVHMASSATRHRVRVVTALEEVPWVMGNESRLRQVFLDLLLRAAQACREGSAGEVRVDVRADPEEGLVVIEVSDTGPTIPPEQLALAFEPQPGRAGLVLGLYSCHQIVTSLGGKIEITSEPASGTKVRVALPAYAPVPRAVSAVGTLPPSQRTVRARVLVIDDEPTVGSAVGRALEEEHDVTLVSSAREALDLLLGQATFDHVICDMMMPGMSGMDIHAELRRTRPGLESRLIFMTGATVTPSVAEFLAAVENPRIEKPFSSRALREILDELGRKED